MIPFRDMELGRKRDGRRWCLAVLGERSGEMLRRVDLGDILAGMVRGGLAGVAGGWREWLRDVAALLRADLGERE